MDIINSNNKCRIEHELINSILDKTIFSTDNHLRIYEPLDEILYTLSKQLNEAELKEVLKNGKFYLEGKVDK